MLGRLLNLFRFNRIFWWVVFVLLIANIVYFISYRRIQDNRINVLSEEYNAKRSTPKVKKDNDQAPLLQAKDDINSFKQALRERKDLAENASELFAIFKQNRIYVDQTVYRPEPIDYRGLFKYTTSLSIKGSYPSIRSLLADIQESRTLFCIEALSISGSPGEDYVEMKVKIATYFR